MLIINDQAGLKAKLPRSVRRILDQRLDLIDLATFLVVQAGDAMAEIEAAAGFPLNRAHPPWEWVLDHGGVYEAPIITSDDGSGTVLIVPAGPGVDALLITMLRDHAVSADAP